MYFAKGCERPHETSFVAATSPFEQESLGAISGVKFPPQLVCFRGISCFSRSEPALPLVRPLVSEWSVLGQYTPYTPTG